MSQFLTLTDDGKIKKEIIHQGSGESPIFGQIVLIHCVGIIQSTNSIFLDTRNSDPLEFTVGKEVIVGLSTGVASMKLGEKSKITISPEYAYGNEGSNDKFKIPPNSTLIFEIELVSMKPFFMNKNDAITSSNQFCENASKLFHDQKYNEAIQNYQSAISGLAQFYGKDVDDITIKIYRNLSVSYAKISKWKESIYNAERVLQKEPNDIRSIARLSDGFLKIGNLEKAKKSIEKGLSLTNNNKIFLKFKEEYDKQVKEDYNRQSQMFKKMAT